MAPKPLERLELFHVGAGTATVVLDEAAAMVLG
jgi:hypothetical protein